MTIMGVALKRPGFWPLTQAIGFGVALWLLLTLSPLGATDAGAAGAAGAKLAAILFGCVSNVCGVEVLRGGRHLALNIAGLLFVLFLYRAVATFF